MKTGVYSITNLVSRKIYIGSTTKSFSHRWGMHLKELRTNTHKNKYLQSSWNKHKESNFQFDIVELCEKELCLEREQFWMDYYSSYNRFKGYNINVLAQSRLGTKSPVGSGTTKCKNIFAYKVNGDFVGNYLTGAHAAVELFTNHKAYGFISEVLHKRKKSYRGYVFSYSATFPGYKRNNKGRGKWTLESKRKASNTRLLISRLDLNIPVIQYLKDGTKVKEWQSGKQAAQELNIKASNISSVLKNKRPSAGNFIWAYK